MKKLNVAIIGTGYMAQQDVNVINSFKEFNIICFLGRNKKKIKKFRKNKIYFKNLFFCNQKILNFFQYKMAKKNMTLLNSSDFFVRDYYI
jgi:hypothetical protein